MRRLAIHLPVAALTFCVGSLAQNLWPASSATYRLPLPVSLCQLAATPGRYDGEEVHVRAVLHANGGEPFVFDDSCASPAARIPVTVDNNALAAWGLPGWATPLAYRGDGSYPAAVAGRWSADVIIIGTFKARRPGLNAGITEDQPSLISRSFLQLSQASERR